MNLATLVPCVLLLAGVVAYIFWPRAGAEAAAPREKTRQDYLRERLDVLYDNLRDLNFEYRAGKFPAEDFERQRESLETEAAGVLAEIDILGAGDTPESPVAAAR